MFVSKEHNVHMNWLEDTMLTADFWSLIFWCNFVVTF